MSNARESESFLPLRRAAVRLGVPAAWLREQALAGTIPCLHVGRRLFFNAAAVEHALLEQANKACGQEEATR